MTDIRDERIVKFTPNEVTELANFLRTFEANPVAVRLLHGISVRSINAVADVEDADHEPYDASEKFGNVREYPGTNGIPVPYQGPITALEREVLTRIAELETRTFDHYVKPEYGTFDAAILLHEKGLVEAKPPRLFLYKTTAAGREVLADIISTDEPSA